jgi:hypothetical protein
MIGPLVLRMASVMGQANSADAVLYFYAQRRRAYPAGALSNLCCDGWCRIESGEKNRFVKFRRFMKSGIKTNDPRAFSGKQDKARHGKPTIYHQAVGVLEALAGMVGDQGQGPLIAAWTKARINPLNPGAITRPAFSARFQAERPAAWWSKPYLAYRPITRRTTSIQ